MTRTYFQQIFKLIFVFFSLYLMGDAFYRWDGFRYYGLFADFFPSLSLIVVLWTFTALFVAALCWLLLLLIEWVFGCIGLKIKREYMLICICFFFMSGILIWFGKKLVFQFIPTTIQTKLLIFSFVSFISILLTWLSRHKAKKLLDVLDERTVPLVWIFGAVFAVSLTFVTYRIMFNNSGSLAQQRMEASPVNEIKRPNIVLVTFDAMTSRDMSLYGYDKSTTPFISEWAKDAAVFKRFEAASNYTAPTTATMVTGKRVWSHRRYHSDKASKPLKSESENFALLLKNAGYYNMAFIQNNIASVQSLGIAGSFDIAPSHIEFINPTSLLAIIDIHLYRIFGEKFELYDWIIRGGFVTGRLLKIISPRLAKMSETEVPAGKVFDRFLKAINENPPEPYFAWVHVYPPHDPYLPPKSFMGMIDESSKMRTYSSQQKIAQYRNQHYPDSIQPEVDILRSRYDEFIQYCDNQYEYLMKELENVSSAKNTVIILSSDHGESFEHNYLMHGDSHLYEQVTHIPLVIKEPGQVEGRIINDIVGQIDLPSTILDFAKIDSPVWMEGRSLVPLIRGENRTPAPVFSMNLETNPSRGHKINQGTVAVWDNVYKLIYYLEKENGLLFNLKEDPDELDNLYFKLPEVSERLLGLIKDGIEAAEKSKRESSPSSP